MLIAAVIVVLLVVSAIVIATAPANWFARWVAARTQGRVLLADARGTIWSGSAVLALGTETPDGSASASGGKDDRLALPGRINWKLEIVRPLAPVWHLTHDGVLLQPVEVRYADHALAISPGAAVLPTSMLRLAGAPLNTLRPEGRSELHWGAVRIDPRGSVTGAGTVLVADLALAVSPVAPLGDYRVTWSSDASRFAWQIATERGPLELHGEGSVAGHVAQMRVAARAAGDASPAVAAQLKTLLDAMGARGGSEAVIAIGGSG